MTSANRRKNSLILPPGGQPGRLPRHSIFIFTPSTFLYNTIGPCFLSNPPESLSPYLLSFLSKLASELVVQSNNQSIPETVSIIFRFSISEMTSTNWVPTNKQSIPKIVIIVFFSVSEMTPAKSVPTFGIVCCITAYDLDKSLHEVPRGSKLTKGSISIYFISEMMTTSWGLTSDFLYYNSSIILLVIFLMQNSCAKFFLEMPEMTKSDDIKCYRSVAGRTPTRHGVHPDDGCHFSITGRRKMRIFRIFRLVKIIRIIRVSISQKYAVSRRRCVILLLLHVLVLSNILCAYLHDMKICGGLKAIIRINYVPSRERCDAAITQSLKQYVLSQNASYNYGMSKLYKKLGDHFIPFGFYTKIIAAWGIDIAKNIEVCSYVIPSCVWRRAECTKAGRFVDAILVVEDYNPEHNLYLNYTLMGTTCYINCTPVNLVRYANKSEMLWNPLFTVRLYERLSVYKESSSWQAESIAEIFGSREEGILGAD